MGELASFRSKGQTAVLIALTAVALVAFVALAIDGSNAYSLRRDAQSAADGGAIAGTWTMVDIQGFDPVAQILRKVNQYCQDNGVRDTNGDPSDVINGNVLVYYVDYDGNRLPYPELHSMDIVPGDARGVEVDATISATTFFARVIGQPVITATAMAAARYEPDGGLLPIAVNEYWYGSQGHLSMCPYENCGPPYSFVRNPSLPPPFRTTDGGATWMRNDCAYDARCCDSYNDDTCQGPYDGFGENFGQAFSLMGQDAYPNDPSRQPRSGVVIDVRYNSLEDNGQWFQLVGDNQFILSSPIPQGQGQHMAEQIFLEGGYKRVPLPRALHEPPPAYYGEDWAYCWSTPPNGCFNYPRSNRSEPYDVLQFLYGSESGHLAHSMYDDGNYVDGRYAPGERIVIMVYNGYPGENWGQHGKKNDAAVVVGYFGAIIVGYGNEFETPDPGPDCTHCRCNGTPGDWQSYVHCIRSQGQPTGVYGLASASGPLTIDPSKLLNEFLPKKITLVR